MQYISHSLTRASRVTVHAWLGNVGRRCSAGAPLLRCQQSDPWVQWGRSLPSLSARDLGSDDNTHLYAWCVGEVLAGVPILGLLSCPKKP